MLIIRHPQLENGFGEAAAPQVRKMIKLGKTIDLESGVEPFIWF
jgi:hypothetical protein